MSEFDSDSRIQAIEALEKAIKDDDSSMMKEALGGVIAATGILDPENLAEQNTEKPLWKQRVKGFATRARHDLELRQRSVRDSRQPAKAARQLYDSGSGWASKNDCDNKPHLPHKDPTEATRLSEKIKYYLEKLGTHGNHCKSALNKSLYSDAIRQISNLTVIGPKTDIEHATHIFQQARSIYLRLLTDPPPKPIEHE